jgi:hypothetical protein
LHVLSTPPAFILSQDQTLNKMVSIQPFRLVQISFIEAFHSFKEIRQLLRSSSFQTQNEQLYNVRFWCFVFLSRCLIYKVHAARSSAFFVCLTGAQLIYQIISPMSTPFSLFFRSFFTSPFHNYICRYTLFSPTKYALLSELLAQLPYYKKEGRQKKSCK